jgi:hypothetical protein
MKNEFHPQLLEDAAAWLFWTLVSRDGFELTHKNVLQTRGQSLLSHPEREIIFRRYPLGEMPASMFSAFCSAVAEHAHARAVRKENLTGMIYSEDRFSGRTSSAAGISASHLDLPVTVNGDSFPRCGSLCLRAPLPAVVFADSPPPEGVVRIADTRALSFSMPLWLSPQTVSRIESRLWLLTGIFFIPVHPELTDRHWKKVIPNGVCARERIIMEKDGETVSLDFHWQSRAH